MQPTVFVNPACAAVANLPLASLDDGQSRAAAEKVLAFHQQVPHYKETPLHAVPQLAEELQLGHVFIKDESNRFGLPSFKILGASWAVVRAVVDELGLDLEEEDSALLLPATTTSTTTGTKGEEAAGGPHDAHIWQHLRASVAGHASGCLMSLVTCTEGNWGRAVARMAKYLSMPAKIYVPSFMPETTRARISAEGAEVIVVHGNYDDSVAAARKEADASENAILVMDIGWDGYEKIPSWVVEGYSTMLRESDAEIQVAAPDTPATHAFVPVGCGSIAQAVTQHYKRPPLLGQPSREASSVIAVEPTTASCLRASLAAGQLTTVQTADSIMCGMNCGTVSSTAWPTLQSGVDAVVTVTDQEAHEAVCELERLGLHSGPCGAATLAALRRACRDAREQLHLTRSSVVILFCTEGRREYEVPV